jgi:hypothetical protein
LFIALAAGVALFLAAYAYAVFRFIAWIWRNFKEAVRRGNDDDVRFIFELAWLMFLVICCLGLPAAMAIGDNHPIVGWLVAIVVFVLALGAVIGVGAIGYLAHRIAAENGGLIVLDPGEWMTAPRPRRPGRAPVPPPARLATAPARLRHNADAPSAP